MSEQSNQAKSIFLAAIDRHTPDQWPAFLERACDGDVVLRAEVEKLLRAQTAIRSFHERRSAVGAESPIGERPGAFIGSYQLLELLGEGGFGKVYMAEQRKPIRRQVALKVLKPGMDTRQVIARFEAEQQALALMDHANIAEVLDAGTTDSGRPYFVMELVKGAPITEFCDQNHLGLEARLKLFIDVCQAIQHAHHKGVIHRDIKPTNVLVTLQDRVPVVKVIDFGVAKAVQQKLTNQTLCTYHGQMIGTPAYMSPEQAMLNGLDIDTRSDVYALGVLLYELLSGTTPLEVDRLNGMGYAELERLIREEPAPRPSARLASLGDAATGLATRRGLDVKRLVQLLAGDLDWIVMKALEKDRNRRYETPASFAEDIARYLRREAILARPPSTLYKATKFVQRNRAAVLTGTIIALALLAGAALATWQAIVATQAQQDALAAAAAEKEASALAQVREAEMRAILEFVENRVFAAARPKGQEWGLGPNVTLRRAVESALPCVQKSFKDQPLLEARLRLTLARSFTYLGEANIAAEQNEAARAIYLKRLGPDHPDTLLSMYYLAVNYAALGRHAEALQLRLETLEKRKATLGPDHADTLRSMTGLANSYTDLGRHAEALQLRLETLALQKAKLGSDHLDTLLSMFNLAINYDALGRTTDAFKLREETLTLMKAKLGPDHPDTLRSMNGLAASYAALARHGEAVKLYEETLKRQKTELGPDHPDTLVSMSNLAISYTALGRHTDALELYQQTLALMKAKLGAYHPGLLPSMTGLANSYAALDRHAEALQLRKKALFLMKYSLGRDHPDTLLGMHNLAMSYAALGRHAEAVSLYDATLALMKTKLGPDHRDTLRSMNSLAVSYAGLGRHLDAVQLFEETMALQKAKLGQGHADTLLTMHNLAISFAALGRHGNALKLRQQTLDLRKTHLGANHPDTARSLGGVGLSCAALGRHAEALTHYDEALALMKTQLGADHAETLRCLDNQAISYGALGRHGQALQFRQETLALREAKLGPHHVDTLRSLWGVADSLFALDRGAEAVALIDTCVERAAGKKVPPWLLPGVLNLRLRHFAKVQDAAGCRQTAEMWENLKRLDGASLYQAACMRAVAAAVCRAADNSPDGGKQADADADRAMAWLKQAVAAGYKNVAHMKKDRDLDALRDRADFAELLAKESTRD
jgi:serine/threonine protein kinase/tetratricopeptide (TPR) repeat protein